MKLPLRIAFIGAAGLSLLKAAFEAMTNPTDTTGAESVETRRKRLRFRSWHRGTREMDLLMGSFADAHIDGFDHAALDRFEALLELSDPDLYNWMTGREPVPAEHDTDVMQLLTRFRYTPRQGS